MRIRLSRKAHLPVLLVGAFCGAAVVLGAQALSKGHSNKPAEVVVKASTADAKPAQSAERDGTTAPEDASAGQNSWKRWPSLTDF